MWLIPSSFILLVTFGFSAYAATGWTQSYAQGTIEARVEATDGSIFGLYCAEGQTDRKLGIQLEKIHSGHPSTQQLVEVIVDSHHFQFSVAGTLSDENTMIDKNQIMIMEDLMVKSRHTNFRVRVPSLNWQRDFSLSGVKKALEGNSPTQLMTDDCTKP